MTQSKTSTLATLAVSLLTGTAAFTTAPASAQSLPSCAPGYRMTVVSSRIIVCRAAVQGDMPLNVYRSMFPRETRVPGLWLTGDRRFKQFIMGRRNVWQVGAARLRGCSPFRVDSARDTITSVSEWRHSDSSQPGFIRARVLFEYECSQR